MGGMLSLRFLVVCFICTCWGRHPSLIEHNSDAFNRLRKLASCESKSACTLGTLLVHFRPTCDNNPCNCRGQSAPACYRIQSRQSETKRALQQVLLALRQSLPHHPAAVASTPRSHCPMAMCTPPKGMRVKELKAELDALGITWRGICTEKEDLVRLLEEARLAQPSSAPPPPSPSAPTEQATDRGGFSAEAQAEAEAEEVNAMSIDEIKKELTELGVEIAADSDKAKLVGDLLDARAFNRPQFDTSQFGRGSTQW